MKSEIKKDKAEIETEGYVYNEIIKYHWST